MRMLRPSSWFAVALVALVSLPAAAQDAKPDAGNKKKDAPQAGAETKKARKPMPRFMTFGQEDWGGRSRDSRAATLLAQNFAKVFPDGLRLGVEGDKDKNHVFKDADGVAKFLPNRGSPGPMKDGTREGAEEAGGLAGHLVAAKLNIQFNRAGLAGAPQEGAKNALDLKELQFRSGVAEPLRGMAVGDVVKLADRALSGAFGSPSDPEEKAIDVNGDGKADVSFHQLRKAFVVFNANFAEGRNEGRLGHKGYTNVRAEDDGEEAAAAAAAAEDDARDEELEREREERDRELEEAEKEYARDLRRARDDAAKQGDRQIYESKKAELDARFAEKRAQIVEKHRAKLRELQQKRAEKPGRGRGRGAEDRPRGGE